MALRAIKEGMTLIKLFLSLSCLFCVSLKAVDKGHILYLVKNQEIERAFAAYRELSLQGHDYTLLEQIANALLVQGIRHSDVEIQLLTMYGLSLSHFQCPLFLLEEGLLSHNPYVQASAVQTLAQMGEDGTDELLIKGMQSSYLMIRIQAAYALAQRGYKKAVGPIESLMQKLPGQAWVFFPELYASLGDKQAIGILKNLTHHPFGPVRLAALFNAAKYRRDDLLPAIRSFATHIEFSEQEMAAFALGTFHDMASKEMLMKLKDSKEASVSLSAAHALYLLGEKNAVDTIAEHAKTRNPFALSLLARYDEGQELLHSLIQDRDPNIRLNVALTLLKRRDPMALVSLPEFLVRDFRDFGFMPIFTPGHTLRAWKIVPLALVKSKLEPGELQAFSLSLREEMLTDAVELEEPLFLMLAHKIINTGQHDLIPLLVLLLQNLDSPAARKLLHETAERAPSKLIQTYSHLALYRMKDPHMSAKPLMHWILSEMDHDMIEFSEKKSASTEPDPRIAYQLSPFERSRLLMECYQALAERRDSEALDMLVTALHKGSPKNRYVIAGLLLCAIQ